MLIDPFSPRINRGLFLATINRVDSNNNLVQDIKGKPDRKYAKCI